jgi:hypothetical protein
MLDRMGRGLLFGLCLFAASTCEAQAVPSGAEASQLTI